MVQLTHFSSIVPNTDIAALMQPDISIDNRARIMELLWVFSCDGTADPKKITDEIILLAQNCKRQPDNSELLEALEETDKDLCVLESTMLQIEQRDHLAEGMTELVKKWRVRNKQAISNYEKQSK
jgi:hypothetical protein